MLARARLLLPIALVAVGGCFATREDVALLQSDLRAARGERAASDSATRAQLAALSASLGETNDSVRALGSRLTRMQGDVRGDLYQLGQQLITIQELSGQSQRRLQELRASLDERQGLAPAAQPGMAPSGAPAGAPAGPVVPSAGTPGPDALFQASLEQLRRGSHTTARAGFEEVLRQYPSADIADDAQFYLGEALSAEGNAAGADSAYAAVVTRWPNSPRAPTAMYKRALAMERGGNAAGMRAVLTDLVARYPRSDEAALARERLRTSR
jgi:tol-pal system protein YbgF